MNLLYTISQPLMFTVILLPCVLLGLAGVWVVRRGGWMLDSEDNSTAALAHAFVGVLYAVALGLMVVGVQSGYAEVEMVVMKEAYLTGDLYIDSNGLSEPDRSEIQRLTKQYLRAVVDEEWAAISRGDDITEDKAHLLLGELAHLIILHEPQSDRGLVVYGEMLGQLNALLDQRRERLHLGVDGVGLVTWIIVGMGAFMTIGMAWFYNTISPRAHYGLVGIMSVMFGLMIFLIVAMDHPLWGQFSVSSGPFSEVIEDIELWEKEFGQQREK